MDSQIMASCDSDRVSGLRTNRFGKAICRMWIIIEQSYRASGSRYHALTAVSRRKPSESSS